MDKTNQFDFKSWILQQQNKEYQIIDSLKNKDGNDDVIQFITDYADAFIGFNDIEDSTVVEFKIISKKDGSIQFYLHFELNDEEHAKTLFFEMIEMFIGLKDKKTTRILLSCSSGLTTAMFAENLNSVAQMLGLDYSFEAVSYMNIYEEIDNYDLLLIAPQIGYMYERLKESLVNKLVLQIPTSIFASYDALEAIKFIQDEIKQYQSFKKEKKEECHGCVEYKKRILSLAILTAKKQTYIRYHLYDKCEIIDQNTIVKCKMNIYDLYDIIDTLLLKHSYIDVVGIATPGIVEDNKMFKEPTGQKMIDMKKDFEEKYGIHVFVCNNANAAAVGFSLAHNEYNNIIYHSQPMGYGTGGQGIVINKKIVRGKNGIVGELKYYLKRMQLSDEPHKLALTQQGTLELVTKSLLPSLVSVGPDVVALYSPMTSDIEEVKNSLKSFVSEEFLPDFCYIKDPIPYMLEGITELSVDYIENDI